ncbi:MAG: BPSS1780 family membrane protein [Pseudomonadota bacterium]
MKLNLVPARTGILWVKLGIRTFFRQPLALAGLFFLYMAAVLLVSQVPVIGPLLGGLLVPAMTLGLMAATAEAAKGKFPLPTVLLSAFRAGRQRARAMLLLGVIYTAGSLLATGLASLIGGPLAITAPGADAAAGAPQLDPSVLIALVLHTPLFLLFWHAPALVHWHGIPPAKSLFFSAVACLRNFGAFAVYSLVWGGVFIVVSLLLGLLGVALGGGEGVRSVMMPTVLLLAAMFSTSMYFTFRDCFTADEEQQPPGGDVP